MKKRLLWVFQQNTILVGGDKNLFRKKVEVLKMETKLFNIGGYMLKVQIEAYTDGNVAILLTDEHGNFWGDLSVNVFGFSGPYHFVLNHDCKVSTYREILDELGVHGGFASYGFVKNQPVYVLNEKYIEIVKNKNGQPQVHLGEPVDNLGEPVVD